MKQICKTLSKALFISCATSMVAQKIFPNHRNSINCDCQKRVFKREDLRSN